LHLKVRRLETSSKELAIWATHLADDKKAKLRMPVNGIQSFVIGSTTPCNKASRVESDSTSTAMPSRKTMRGHRGSKNAFSEEKHPHKRHKANIGCYTCGSKFHKAAVCPDADKAPPKQEKAAVPSKEKMDKGKKASK